MLNVHSVYRSIDGEVNGALGAGQLSTFIRLKGCNLRCAWCDTRYAQAIAPVPEAMRTVSELVHQVEEDSKITLTGGEPFLQTETPELIAALLDERRERVVTIETNGTQKLPHIMDCTPAREHWTVRFGRRLILAVDYKLPSAAIEIPFWPGYFRHLRSWDILKFAIADRSDYAAARNIWLQFPKCLARLVISPVDPLNGDIARNLVEWLIYDHLEHIQFSLQIHKVLWPSDDNRGLEEH